MAEPETTRWQECRPPNDDHPLHWIDVEATYPMVMLWKNGGWHKPGDHRIFSPEVAGVYRGWRYLGPAIPPEGNER